LSLFDGVLALLTRKVESLFSLLKMGMFDENETLALHKLQEIHEKNVVSLQECHNWLHEEVKDLQIVVALLQTKNAGLKN
jgi:hypothetical protein